VQRIVGCWLNAPVEESSTGTFEELRTLKSMSAFIQFLKRLKKVFLTRGS